MVVMAEEVPDRSLAAIEDTLWTVPVLEEVVRHSLAAMEDTLWMLVVADEVVNHKLCCRQETLFETGCRFLSGMALELESLED